MSDRTQAERITALEEQMSYVIEQQKEGNDKLDQLLELKNKGMGCVDASLYIRYGLV
jgi:hypothetical protein